MIRLKSITLLIAILTIFAVNLSFAETPLEIIQVFDGDSADVLMSWGCTSPGDLDGDGFSEIFVSEKTSNKRVIAFSGGNPPNDQPDMIMDNSLIRFKWLSDINGDGVKDFIQNATQIDGLYPAKIWFGDTDFLSKIKADLVFAEGVDTFYYFGYTFSSGDINGDKYDDLIIANLSYTSPFAGRFSIYYGGLIFDTIPDDVINIYSTTPGYNDFKFGISLGDINNDSLVDFGYSIYKNESYISYIAIIFGNSPLDTLPALKIASPFDWYHSPGGFGKEIVPLGDINRDDFDDFAVGELWPCIFYGGDPFDTIPKILGDTSNSGMQATCIANIGDINHDGWDDIGVGYTAYNFGDGIVYIYYGSNNMDTEVDLIIYEDELWPIAAGHFGESVGPAGDFNGDGIDDLVVSAEQWLLSSQGRVFVFAGDSGLATPAEDEPDMPIPGKYNILKQNYPNPFNNGTVIEYTLWGLTDREIELGIYNILGQRIRILRKGIESGGNQIAYWDGKDDFGNYVCSGLYFYRLKTDSEVLSKKMIYLK